MALKVCNDLCNVILQKAYPVNSIYISISPTNPNTTFGFGTWVQLKNAFLFATNATSGNKGTGSGTGTSTGTSSPSTGGSSAANTGSTTLTESQIPSHFHEGIYWSSGSSAMGLDTGGNQVYLQHGWNGYSGYMSKNKLITGKTGGGSGHTHSMSHTHTVNSHSHTVPYLEVYVWKRTA